MRICVFCSSAEGLPDAYVDAAIHLGTLIGAHGHELVFGGYDDGLMGAVAFGAKRAGARVTGVLPAREGDLPGRVSFPCDELVEARGLSQRKVEMMRLADAFVALPGSYGTLDELYEVLAAEKLAGAGRPDDGAGECGAGTGKAGAGSPRVAPRIRPVALLDVDGFYAPLVELHRRMAADGFMGSGSLAMCASFSTADELIAYLESSCARPCASA